MYTPVSLNSYWFWEIKCNNRDSKIQQLSSPRLINISNRTTERMLETLEQRINVIGSYEENVFCAVISEGNRKEMRRLIKIPISLKDDEILELLCSLKIASCTLTRNIVI